MGDFHGCPTATPARGGAYGVTSCWGDCQSMNCDLPRVRITGIYNAASHSDASPVCCSGQSILSLRGRPRFEPWPGKFLACLLFIAHLYFCVHFQIFSWFLLFQTSRKSQRCTNHSSEERESQCTSQIDLNKKSRPRIRCANGLKKASNL